jgi:hypothetical protein
MHTANMHAAVNGLARWQPADPHWANVVLLLRGNGAQNGTTIVDSSPYAHTLTNYGNVRLDRNLPPPGAARPYSADVASMYFDGTGDGVSAAAHSAFAWNGADWTVEGFAYMQTTGDRCAFDNRNGSNTGCGIYLSLSAGTHKLGYASNAAVLATSSNSIPNQAWTHWAVTRAADTVRGYLAGSKGFEYTDTRTFASSGVVPFVGCTYSQGQGFLGSLDEVRLTKGVARYTGASFTPPTMAFPNF